MKYCPICGGPIRFGQKTVREDGVKMHRACLLDPSVPHQYGNKYIYPGFWDRCGARINDGLILGIPFVCVRTALRIATGFCFFKYPLFAFVTPQFILSNLYWIFVCWMMASRTQSWGMRFKHIQILTLKDERAGFFRIWVRDLFNSLTLGLGNLLILWHPERRSLADVIFKTKFMYVADS